jgi:hypothetical protein
VVDITNASVAGLAAAGSLDDGNGDDGAAVALASAGIFGASAIYGLVKTQSCNKAKDELRIRLMKIFAREAELRAAEQARERPRALEDVLTHPKRLPKRKKHRRAEPPPAEALPPAPPPPDGELPPAPPPPPAAAPPSATSPAPAAPASSALPPAPAAPPSAAFPTAPPAPPPPAPAPVR